MGGPPGSAGGPPNGAPPTAAMGAMSMGGPPNMGGPPSLNGPPGAPMGGQSGMGQPGTPGRPGEEAIGGNFNQAQLEAQCDQRFMKLTVGQIPNSASLSQQSGLPIGVVLRPLAPDENGEDDI